MKFSDELKAWRGVDDSGNNRGDFTQKEAAAFLGDTPLKTYIDWEQDRRTPPTNVQALIRERMKKKPKINRRPAG